MKAKLVMVDDEYTFLLEDGTIIESDKIGWVNVGSMGFDIYERFTHEDAQKKMVMMLTMELLNKK